MKLSSKKAVEKTRLVIDVLPIYFIQYTRCFFGVVVSAQRQDGSQ